MKRSGPLPHSTVRLVVLLAVIALALVLAMAAEALAQEPPTNPVPPAAAPRAAANPGGACGPNPSPPAALTPAIRVTAPAPFAVIGSPLRAEGVARVFEGTVRYTVRDAAGSVLADGFTTAAAGAPDFGPFSFTVRFAAQRETPVCLQVFEESAEDGRAVNIVQIPVTLRPFNATDDRGADTGAGLRAAAGLTGPHWIEAVVDGWALVRSADSSVLLRRDQRGRWSVAPAGESLCADPETPPLLCALPPMLADTSALPALAGRSQSLGGLRFLVPEAATLATGTRPGSLSVELELPPSVRPPSVMLQVSAPAPNYGPLDAWVYDRVMDNAGSRCPVLLSRAEVNGRAAWQLLCPSPLGGLRRWIWAAPPGGSGPVLLVESFIDRPALNPWQPLLDQITALLLGSLLPAD